MLLEENHEISSIFKDLSDLSACPNCRNMQLSKYAAKTRKVKWKFVYANQYFLFFLPEWKTLQNIL